MQKSKVCTKTWITCRSIFCYF